MKFNKTGSRVSTGKIILILVAIAVLSLMAVQIFLKEKQPQTSYILDREYRISEAALKQYKTKVRLEPSGDDPQAAEDDSQPATTDAAQAPAKLPEPVMQPGEFFPEGMVTASTINFFRYLQHKFKGHKTLEALFDDVRDYLDAHFPPEQAEALMNIFRRTTQCEIDLVYELRKYDNPKDHAELLEQLAFIQNFRRSYLGAELADSLFGAEVKLREYEVRRAAIVYDKSMSGTQKEARIRELNGDMWGEEVEAVEDFSKPYDQYQEKIRIYKNDLDQMASDEERLAKIREFRSQFFSPDVVAKLNENDEKVLARIEQEKTYRAQETKIMNDPDLTEAEKTQQVETLQDDIFGEDVESFRRKEKVREIKDRVLEKYGRE